MRAIIASAVLLVPLAASSVEAQQQRVLSQRVAKSMPTSYRAPDCGLKSGHFKVSSGATYLKTGVEADIPDNAQRALDNGEKVLLEAMRQNNQANNPAAWYYLGRIYLQRGDLYGADSALTRAEKLAPACAKEIDGYRQNAWVALIKGGNGFEEQKNLDSALALYNQAGVIFRKSPIPYYQAAVVYNEQGKTDSAAVSYGRAVAAGANATDTTEKKIRDRSAFNQGALLLNAQKHAEAAAAFERYLQWMPNDIEAKRGLAAAYRGLGQADKAQALEQQIVAAGGSAGGGAAGGGGAGSADLMNVGVNLYNDKKYAEAAEAFAKVAQAEPHNRDALFNLANTYWSQQAWDKMMPVARRLAEVDPNNQDVWQLMAIAYKGRGDAAKAAKNVRLERAMYDSAVKHVEKKKTLTSTLAFTHFTHDGPQHTLRGNIQNAGAKPATYTVKFEFLDSTGKPVAAKEVTVGPVEPNKSAPFSVEVSQAGIVAFRYAPF